MKIVGRFKPFSLFVLLLLVFAASHTGFAKADDKPERVTIGMKEMSQRLTTYPAPVYPP